MLNHRIRNPFINHICLIAVIVTLSFLSGCTDNSNIPPVPAETVAITVPTPVVLPERGEPTDVLVPRTDYGILVPYHGANTAEGAPLYGLLTSDGEAVTKPVYTVIDQGFQFDGLNESETPTPREFFLLSKTLRSSEGDVEGPFALAASDGSWCTDFQYKTIVYSDLSFLTDMQDNLIYLDKDGTERFRMKLDAPYTAWGARCSEGTLSLEASEIKTTLLIDTETDERIEVPGVSLWGGFHEGLASTVFMGLENGFGYINQEGETVISPQFIRGDDFQNGVAVVTLPDLSQGLINKEGTLLLQSGGNVTILNWDDGLRYLFYDNQAGEESKVTAVYDESLHLVDSPLVGRAVQPLGGSWVWYRENGSTTFVRGTQTKTIQIAGRPILMRGDKVVFENTPGAPVYEQALVTLDGTVLIPYGTYSSLNFEFDLVTGAPYVRAVQNSGSDPDAEPMLSIFDMDGVHLTDFTEHQYITMAGGNLLFDCADFSGLRDLEGKWLFYTSLQSDEAG